MYNIASFPGKYIQGRAAIQNLKSIIKQFGCNAIVLTTPSAKQYIPSEYFQVPLSSSVIIEPFGGECSEIELEKLSRRIAQTKTNVVVGMGGGKVIDTAKIAADRASIPVIIVPTIASTDAPCSGCAVTYSPEGVFERVYYQRSNPAVVLVDEEIIAKAPARFLAAGMGDALATWFEARSCRDTASVNECGGLSTLAGQNLAELCFNTLLKEGIQAKLDHESGKLTTALSNIIEVNILLSGIGFESGGLASAHAIHNGLTILPETHKFYHGEKVAFGVLTGLHLNNATPEEISSVCNFCVSVGLPVTLSEIGISDYSRENIMKVAHKSTESGSSIHHEKGEITAEKVYAALMKADEYGRRYIENT